MAGYLLHRGAGAVGVLFAMSVLIFAAVHILPGNVAYAILGEFATPANIAVLEAKLGLNDPLAVQYWHWLDGMLHGDLGLSVTMQRPAAPLILEALGRSAILAGFAFALVASGGIALGVVSATHQGRFLDRITTFAQLLFIAIPEFFWGILVVLLFASWMQWLPATGYASIAQEGAGAWASHLLLPVLVLSFGLVAHVSRLTRSTMIDVLQKPLRAGGAGQGVQRVARAVAACAAERAGAGDHHPGDRFRPADRRRRGDRDGVRLSGAWAIVGLCDRAP